MEINPYASYLGQSDPLAVIEETPKFLDKIFAYAGHYTSLPIAPGKWSPKEVLCHLADTEIVFAYRLRQALAEDHHMIQPFDQDVWAKQYRVHDAASALSVFTGVRAWNLALIRSLTPEQLARPVTHPERGTMTVQTIVETMAGHDLNHRLQLERKKAL